MERITKWLAGPAARVFVHALRLVVPPFLAGLLGVLMDAGLLDGELGRALVGLLN